MLVFSTAENCRLVEGKFSSRNMAAEVLEGKNELLSTTSDEISEPAVVENANRHPAHLLIFVGEPFNEEQRSAIADKLKRGLGEWDAAAAECGLVDQLDVLFTGDLPVSADDRCIQLKSEQLFVEVITSSSTKLAAEKLKSFAASETHYRFLLHAGLSFQPTGSWVLNDGQLTYAAFRDLFLGNINGRGPIDLSVTTQGSWSSANLTKLAPDNRIRVKASTSSELSQQFDKLVSAVVNRCEVKAALELLLPSDDVGSVVLSKPTLYAFPAGDGISAVVGVRGFTLLVDGGYFRKSCFWDLVRHIESIDAVLVSHLAEDNIFGLGTFLERKTAEKSFPSVGPVFVNYSDPKSTQVKAPTTDSLAVNVADESAAIVAQLYKLHPDIRSCVATGPSAVPVNLYYKVGFGSLDMYVLNPTADNKDLKEYLAAGAKGDRSNRPLYESLSVCAIVVFKPAGHGAHPARILFPGAASQSKLFEGLDRVKTNPIFQSITGVEKKTAAHPATKSASSSVRQAPPASEKSAKPPAPSASDKSAKPPTNTAAASKSAAASHSAGQHEKSSSRPPTGAGEKEVKKDEAKKVETKKSVDTKATKPLDGTSEHKKPAASADHKSNKLPTSKEHDKDSATDAAKKVTVAKTATSTKSEPSTSAKPAKKVEEPAKKTVSTKKAPSANGKVQPAKTYSAGDSNASPVKGPPDSTTTNVDDVISVDDRPTVEDAAVPQLVEIVPEASVVEEKSEIISSAGSGDDKAEVGESNGHSEPVDESVALATDPDVPTDGVSTEQNVEAVEEKPTVEPVDEVTNDAAESSNDHVTASGEPAVVEPEHVIENNHDQLSDGHEEIAADSTTPDDLVVTDQEAGSSQQDLQAIEEQSLPAAESTSFDPAGEWGEPQALPAPTAAATNSKTSTASASSDKARSAAGKAEFKAPAPKTSTVAAKKLAATNLLNATHIAAVGDAGRRPSTGDSVRRSRLSLQPSEFKQMLSGTPTQKSAATADAVGAKKHVSSKPIVPVYVDTAYLPVGAGAATVDVDFFKRVRARNYVISACTADPVVMAMLIDAKASWETNSEVTVLPTGNADEIYNWYAAHRDVATSLNVTLTPSASKCTVSLQGSVFAGYRLEF